MAVTYCTALQIAAFMQIDDFSGSTTPTTTEVEDIINDNEDSIDQQTHHAFRAVTITNEYHDWPFPKRYYRPDGIPVFLSHREIRLTAGLVLDTAAGDKLEVFDGANFIDWTASASFTEGRGDDYWIEPDRGILWMRNTSFYPRQRSIRLTYRFGAASVPNDIRRATILLTAAFVLSNEDYSMKMPEGTDGIPHINKAENWRREAERILMKREEIGIPTI